MNSEFRRGAIAAFPLMVGFIPLALILGAQASQAGQSFVTAYLMTAINFAGGSEFAVLGVWAVVPPIFTVILSTGLINSRHIIMGANLAPYIQKESGLRIFFLYFVMCDETWALSMQDIQRRREQNLGFSFWYHMGVGVSLWLMWSWSTCMGAVIGNSFGDMTHYGFEMALPATFIGLSIALRPRGKENLHQYIPIAVSFGTAFFFAAVDLKTYSVGGGALSGLLVAYCVQIYKEHQAKQAALAQQAAQAASDQSSNHSQDQSQNQSQPSAQNNSTANGTSAQAESQGAEQSVAAQTEGAAVLADGTVALAESSVALDSNAK